jgi:isoleucyl-tRNA synthetase
MPFEKVDTHIDFPAQERRILEFWTRQRTFEQLCQKNRGKPKWSFLDGPITANNPMGVHHAWGRTYKDAFQRYFAMTSHELRYQNGFDCQGLWVEVEVEKELGLRSKRDIEGLVPGDRFASIDRFVSLCKERVDKFARRQTEQSIRLGYWMNWDRDEDWQKPADERRSYFTMSAENNYTIWSFLKKCHERGLIYRGYDAMPWCPRCGVGISQMEMHEGYELVAQRAVFVRFPLRGRDRENLLIWTTTPWTLSSNVAAAVNPNLSYLKVKHRDDIYYVAKGAFTARRLEEEFKRKQWVEGVPRLKTLEQLFKEKGGFEIVAELPGSAMVGWTYDGPYDHLPAQAHPGGFPAEIAEVSHKTGWGAKEEARKLHRIVAWDLVGEVEGTGIVHIAPGCGKEDFALGQSEHMVAIAPLDEDGVYIAGFGPLEGRSAVDPATADWILDDLAGRELLFAAELYPHNYPHCWRCKTELLFRLVDEWFINMSWRDEIMQMVEQAEFLPESINGKARELDWLRNMGDWMISKKRYWGLALPIWVCEQCGNFEVMGGHDELKRRAVAGWERFEGHTPHRPWIDLVKVDCAKCGGRSNRIPDVGNPWLDAGIVPYSTLRYNHDRAYWEKWFPADLITESFPGQFRNWFYALLAMSTMMTGRPPFRTLFGHALVRDEEGEEMHKSKGNAILFEAAADSGWEVTTKDGRVERKPPMGADLMRWMFCRHNPALNINFGSGPAEELRNKFVLKLWNTYAFFCNYARLDRFDPRSDPVPLGERPDIDRWILSDLQLLIETARTEFERFNIQAFCLAAEEFVDDRLSNWYVRRNRRRFWKSEQGADKSAAYQTLYTVLVTLAKLFAPVVPFLSEVMYQNLVETGGAASVHLCVFPEPDEKLIDQELSAHMDALLRLVSLGSAARNTVKIRVRQPLSEIRIRPRDESERKAMERFGDQICEELNVKRISRHESKEPLLRSTITPNLKILGPKFGPRLKEVQEAITMADASAVATAVQAGRPVELASRNGPIELAPDEILVQTRAAEGWAGIADRGTQIAIDVRITPELAREGSAREVVRRVQELRKECDLQMDDRIQLHLGADDAGLNEAIQAHLSYIRAETLAAKYSAQPLGGTGIQKTTVKIDGRPLQIQLRRLAIEEWRGST